MRYVIKFKGFSCPPEGGVITGQTVEGLIAKGIIKSNHRLDFTLTNFNDQILFYFFDATMNEDKKSIIGSFGLKKDMREGKF